MSNSYFRLYSECFLVTGKKRSVLCHLLKEEMVWLNEVNTGKMEDAEANQPVDPHDPLFEKLAEMNFGFFSNRKVYIDKMRPINSFSQKKLWQDAPRIHMAVLHVTNQCNLDCSFCKDSFCPVCKQFEHNGEESLSYEHWRNILTELAFFGTTTVLFTGGEATQYPYIYELIDLSQQLGLATNLHTNGMIPPRRIHSKLGVQISVTHKPNVKTIIRNYYKVKDQVTLLVEDQLYNEVKQIVGPEWKTMKTTIHKPLIVKERLVKPSMNSFYSRKLSDACLNGKIAISHVGDVYPCLGSQTPVLNLKKDSLSQAIKVLVSDYWKQNVDVRDHQLKCQECEFRYSCNACRFLNTEENCTYSLEEATWL